MDALTAIRAYSAAQGSAAPASGPTEAAAPGFDDMLAGFMGQATDATRSAESQIAAHSAGQTDLVNVVTAIASAEASLETVVAVRDQVISAYQEIMRMPI
ncbi:MAG: flagellar hook-basal body complex protein FliE [Caulobacterales bacterium]|nr:flagellar hook-basal body complex protein FliE [Caulobacterales bacterium]